MIGNAFELYLQDREISDGATREFLLAEAALKDVQSSNFTRPKFCHLARPGARESSTGFFFVEGLTK